MTTIASICNRDVAFTMRGASIAAAAQLMRETHVGSLIVVEQTNGGRRIPVGIVTDRDLVVEVLATGLDPAAITVGDIMSPELVVGRESASLLETTQIMRFKGVRRLPIVDADGQLVGIVTIDDALELLADELNELAKVVARGQSNEAAARR